VCFDTRGTSKLDGILAINKVGIQHAKSCTLAIRRVGIHIHNPLLLVVEIMMYTYTNVKFNWKIHWESTFINDPFNSWYWDGWKPENDFFLTRLGQERWNAEIDGWIKKSLERSRAMWVGPWRFSKLKSKLMLWRCLYIVGVLTVRSCVTPSSPLAIVSTKSSVFGLSLKGQANYFFNFFTFFTLWFCLTPLKFKFVEVAFSKLASPNVKKK
jgi:hypothetical protein